MRKEDVKEETAEVFRMLEDQVVITATRSRTRLRDAPAAVHVITNKQIRERGYRTLVDALHDIPGFDIIHVYGIFPDLIHQRGLVGNNQRTLLYINGVLDNNITESAILGGSLRYPLYNVDRIEVVSGPASALYGANAFNGVINIITKKGGDEPGTQAHFLYGGYESKFRNPGAAVSLSLRGEIAGEDTEENFEYSLAGYYYKTQGPNFGGIGRLEKPTGDSEGAIERKFDGAYALESELCGGVCLGDSTSLGYYWSPYFNVAYEDTYDITAGFRRGGLRFQTVNWQYIQGNGTFANGTAQSDIKKRGLETSAQDERNNYRRLGVLLGIAKTEGFSGSYWNFRNNSASLGYEHEFGKKLKLDSEIIARHTEVLSSSTEEYPVNAGPYSYLEPGNVTRAAGNYGRPDYSYELEERLEYTASRDSVLTLGLETIYSVVPSGYGSRQRLRNVNYGSYVQWLIRPLEALALTLGYRYDQNTDYGKSYTPRISAVYSPSRELTLKLLLSGGFRAPTAWELFNATVFRRANPDLKPERLRSAEVGIGYRFLKRYFVNVQGYYNDISDLLLEVETADPNPNAAGSNFLENNNVGRARILGSEITGDFPLSDRFSVYANYTYNRGYYTDLPDPVTLSSSPSTNGRPGDDPVTDWLVAAYKQVRMSNPTLVEFLENETGHEFSPYQGPIPNIAPHQANLGGTWKFTRDTSLHLRANYVDIRRTLATNPRESVAPYVLWHSNLRIENIFSGATLEILVRNLGNQLHFDPGIRAATGGYYPTRHPLEKRNIWVTLEYVF